MLQFRVVELGAERRRPGRHADHGQQLRRNDKSQVPPTADRADPDRRAGARRAWSSSGRAGNGDSRDPNGPVHARIARRAATFPWTIKVNGQAAHSMNANRISLLIPKPGEIEHWTYINGGGGWDHPIHLHFEEGITMNRGSGADPGDRERWSARTSGACARRAGAVPDPVRRVRRLLRQPLPQHGARGLRPADAHPAADRRAGSPQTAVTATPNPTPDGVRFTTPEILKEGDPRTPQSVARRRIGRCNLRLDDFKAKGRPDAASATTALGLGS